MEKIMSKTNDTSKTIDTSKPTALEDHRPLADTELDAASGGTLSKAVSQGVHFTDAQLTVT